MTNEEHNRIVRAGLGMFKHLKPDKKSPIDDLMNRVMQITLQVREAVKPVLKAGGWKDKQALYELLSHAYVEAFAKMSKEELENLCTILHVELMMETIEASPYGDDTPDLLSGR